MWLEDFQNEHGETVRIIADAVSRPLVECALDRAPSHRQRSQISPEVLLIFVGDICTELQALVETHRSAETLNILCRCHPAPIAAADDGDRAAQVEIWLETWIDAWFADVGAIAPLLSLCLQSSGYTIQTRHAQDLQSILTGIGPCAFKHYAMGSRDVCGQLVRRLPEIAAAILDAPSLLCLMRGPKQRRDAIWATYSAIRQRRIKDQNKLFSITPHRHHGLELTLFYGLPAAHPSCGNPVRAATTERFLQRFDRQYHTGMRRFARIAGADDLIACNPALALSLACWPEFLVCSSIARQEPMGLTPPFHCSVSGRALIAEKLRAPQRTVLAWLGFPDSDSCRRWLAQLVPECFDIALLLKLRRVMHEPARFAKLRHARPCSHAQLAVLLDPSISDRLPLRLMQCLRPQPAAATVDWYPALTLLCKQGAAAPTVFNSLEALLDWHTDQVGSRTLRGPVADTEFRQRITTATGLATEGSDMAHCLGIEQYGRLLIDGNALFYRVLKPVRATAMYKRCDGVWVLKEITGRRGRKLRPGELKQCLRVMCSSPPTSP